MTAVQAYQEDATFKSLVDIWVAERRCPLVLVDRCFELGMESQAECARWCALEPDKEVFRPWPKERDGWCGPYPSLMEKDSWMFRTWQDIVSRPHRVVGLRSDVDGRNPLEAILMYMDAFDPKLVPTKTA